MNCKKGDPVVAIKDIPATCVFCGGKSYIRLAGHVNRVVELADNDNWVFEKPAYGIRVESACGNNGRIDLAGVQDQFLKPLEDKPGDDESLLWKPVPNKETAS